MRASRGFTLIELLLVIVIFIITFAALTPIVNKMKERAHMIKCMNNARSLSLALHMYAADHGEAFPATLSDEEIVNALAQYLDFEPIERQALLERAGVAARCEGLIDLLEMKSMADGHPPDRGLRH